MKKIIIIVLFPLFAFSQGLINNGARIVFVGAAQMYIDGSTGNYLSQSSGSITPSATSSITLLGNWTNNSANVAFTSDGGGVVLAGTAQTINGSNATAFYNLSLAGNGIKTLAVNSTTVGGQSLFTGALGVGSSTLDLNGNRLDVTNALASAITRSSGYIISETNAGVNPSIIRWYHRLVGGTKIYPFGVAGSYIPFTFDITVPMTNASAYVDVSTRSTAAADNQPWAGPSNVAGVGHMYSPNPPISVDGSIPSVVDRWWDITNSHAVLANVTFSYRGSENTLNDPLYFAGAAIGAQYWDGTAWMPNNSTIGSAASVTSGVGAVTANNLSSFCPWVLSLALAPLPVELLDFNAVCLTNEIAVEWCTSSEKDNSYFTVEQSADGINFLPIGQLFGNGTTNQKHCYKYLSSSVSEISYFKLITTDKYGMKNASKIISVAGCNSEGENILITNDGSNQVGVILNSLTDQNLQLYVHNALGQLVQEKEIKALKGPNNIHVDLTDISNALYYVSVYNGEEKKISKKILVTDLMR
ncbi:MAG: hypothetical protein V4580_07760 [Bacteroidota bacterium]